MRTAVVFDTETTGLPSKTRDVRLVSIAWVVIREEEEGYWTTCKESEHVVRPDGFEIPERATRVHNITTECAIQSGEPIDAVLEWFMADVRECDLIVAHNVTYDVLVISTELRILGTRPEWQTMFDTTPKACTMRMAQKKFGGRAMSLSKTYERLFDRPWSAPLHSAIHDTNCCVEIYARLDANGGGGVNWPNNVGRSTKETSHTTSDDSTRSSSTDLDVGAGTGSVMAGAAEAAAAAAVVVGVGVGVVDELVADCGAAENVRS